MPTDFLGLFALLNATGTRFLLVGELATVMHGVDRTTAGVDLVIDLAPESARAVVMALTRSGYRPMAPVDPALFSDETIRGQWQQLHGMQVFSLWDTENRRPTVDILLAPPVSFTELWRDAVDMTFRGVTVRVASIPHLVRMKEAASRPQDRADVERLLAVLRTRTRPS